MKPNIISHRGANFFAPQNTIPAFKKSLEIGVDGFETDVHLSKDGIPVICHNYTVNSTSNGKGNISELTYEELKKLDFGSYFAEAYRGVQLPSVDEFLKLVSESDIKVLNIELKSPKSKAETQIVEKTLALVEKYGLSEKLLLSSFDPKLLVQAKEIMPECKTGLLYSPDKALSLVISKDPVKFARDIRADALHPHEIYVNKSYVLKAHLEGLIVNPWTVDKPKNIEKMLNCRVDGIITNRPDLVKHLMNVRRENS